MQREGQARSPTKRERDSAKAKPYKHTQTLVLRKVGGIVRFWMGWGEGDRTILKREVLVR